MLRTGLKRPNNGDGGSLSNQGRTGGSEDPKNPRNEFSNGTYEKLVVMCWSDCKEELRLVREITK